MGIDVGVFLFPFLLLLLVAFAVSSVRIINRLAPGSREAGEVPRGRADRRQHSDPFIDQRR
jgi:hypothetical protein